MLYGAALSIAKRSHVVTIPDARIAFLVAFLWSQTLVVAMIAALKGNGKQY